MTNTEDQIKNIVYEEFSKLILNIKVILKPIL